MQKVLTAQEMREVDYDAVVKLRITEKQLMELAGKESCNILLQKYGNLAGKSFLILAGKGNNGGDGIVLARHLVNAGAKVDLVYLCQTALLKQDGAATLRILSQYVSYTDQLRAIEADEMIPAFVIETKYDFVVDAILGTGYRRSSHPKGIQRREANNPFLPKISEEALAEPAPQPVELQQELRPSLSPLIKEAILLINEKRATEGATVIALNIPTGIDGTTGEADEVAVEADLTIALGFLKTGFFFGKGRQCAGEVVVADISIPKFLTKPEHCNLVNEAFVASHLPVRLPQSAKHENGKVLAVVGSQSEEHSMMGAALMSIRAAVKMGAGYVCAAVPPSAFNTVHLAIPEAVLISQSEEQICERARWADAILIGCGLGRTPERQALIARLLTSPDFQDKKLVIDADALYAIAELGLLGQLQLSNAILTPHLGEFERLTGVAAEEVSTDKLYYAREFAKQYSLGLLLKGAPTLIVAQGHCYLSNSGTAALATAGTGDVLAGMIVSLAAQGLSIDVAAACAAYLHGEAGKTAEEAVGMVSATDVLRAL
ncbi:MAG: NAD(P)H-hydrate dehydratase [Chloroherpetonaceae bacterium]|nr:NAD(P)H-hydrate dehydratase [Chloroherpetonaceae bacterium]